MRPLEARCRLDLGVLYGRLGRPDPARDQLSRAAETFRVLGMHIWLGRAESELGALALR
jgi:hypothetical protein